jgi:hypothetical protein
MSAHWTESNFKDEQNAGVVLLDKILESYRGVIGIDFQGYRNHCQRVYLYTLRLTAKPPSSSSDAKEYCDKIATAVAFHDIGLWTAKTVDYIDPSEEEGMKYLTSVGKTAWKEEVSLMITRHHQILQGTLITGTLPETFRRADLVDFSWGLITWGVPRKVIIQTQGLFINAGFHWGLVCKAIAWFFQHPLNPAPMMRWSG